MAIEYYFSIYGLGEGLPMRDYMYSDLSYPTYPVTSNTGMILNLSLGASGAVSAVLFAAIISIHGAVCTSGAIKLSALVFAVLYIGYCVYMGKKRRRS